MGIMIVKLKDDIEKRFRDAAMRIFGAKKGSLSKAFEEAITTWLKTVELERNVNQEWKDLRIKVHNKKLVEKVLDESKKVDKGKISKLLEVLGLEEN